MGGANNQLYRVTFLALQNLFMSDKDEFTDAVIQFDFLQCVCPCYPYWIFRTALS